MAEPVKKRPTNLKELQALPDAERRAFIEEEAARPVEYQEPTPWASNASRRVGVAARGGQAPQTPLKKRLKKQAADVQADALE
jgi:hypothetical protein